MPAAHLFVADLDTPLIADEDRHHIERVLRLRDGEEVTVSDGAGGLRACAFRTGGLLEPTAGATRSPSPSPAITVGFALVKNDRPEWIVQKLTECGVDTIVPFVAARSVVRWTPDKAAAHVERWQRIAREAAMQSRRVWLPKVASISAFAHAVARIGPAVALAEAGGPAPTVSTATVFIGPEGGWAPEEAEATALRVGLGPHVLRAETAAVAAGVLLAALRSRLVKPAENGH